jgi:hypothetical protein
MLLLSWVVEEGRKNVCRYGTDGACITLAGEMQPSLVNPAI